MSSLIFGRNIERNVILVIFRVLEHSGRHSDVQGVGCLMWYVGVVEWKLRVREDAPRDLIWLSHARHAITIFVTTMVSMRAGIVMPRTRATREVGHIVNKHVRAMCIIPRRRILDPHFKRLATQYLYLYAPPCHTHTLHHSTHLTHLYHTSI